MYLLFTFVEILILIALAAIIIAAIAVLIIRLRRSGGNDPLAQQAIDTLRDLENKVNEVSEKDSASASDCTEMRNLLAAARSAGVPTVTTDRIEAKIKELCPDN
jgi:hypothetical protein